MNHRFTLLAEFANDTASQIKNRLIDYTKDVYVNDKFSLNFEPLFELLEADNEGDVSFTIGSKKYEIKGEVMMFQKGLLYRLYKNDEHLSDFDFYAQRSDDSRSSHIATFKGEEPVMLSNAVYKFVQDIYRELQDSELKAIEPFTQPD